MPRLWKATIESHRIEVREAIIEATVALVSERGLLAVTMTQVAERVGIGRATLYKYFPDVESILVAWHEAHVATHLAHLHALAEKDGDPGERLVAVLHGFATMTYHRKRHGTEELGALLHRGDNISAAQQELNVLIRTLVAEAATAGNVRADVQPDELATYCLHALSAASTLSSQGAVNRLAQVVMDALRPPGSVGRSETAISGSPRTTARVTHHPPPH